MSFQRLISETTLTYETPSRPSSPTHIFNDGPSAKVVKSVNSIAKKLRTSASNDTTIMSSLYSRSPDDIPNTRSKVKLELFKPRKMRRNSRAYLPDYSISSKNSGGISSKDTTLSGSASSRKSISEMLDELEEDVIEWKLSIAEMQIEVKRVARSLDEKKVPSWKLIV